MDFLKRASGGPGAMIRAAFVVVCILATSAALGIVLGRFLNISPALGAGLVLLALMVVALGLWAFQMSKAMETMRAHALALANFETSLADKLDAMNAEATLRDERIESLRSTIAGLEIDVAALRDVPDAGPPARPIVLAKPSAPAEPAAVDEPKADAPPIPADFKRDALSLHLQPVVSLPDRQPKHFLVSMRMQNDDGSWLGDEDFDRLTRAGRLLPQMERKMLFAAVRMQRRLGEMNKRTSLICPLSEQTLTNTASFAPILEFAQANAALGPSVTFATSARDQARLSSAAQGRLGDLVAAGFGLARMGITDLGVGIDALAENGVRFLGIERDTLLRAKADEALGVGEPATFATRLRAAGIGLIVTGVADENGLAALSDYDVDLAVGALFAPPRPVRVELEEDGA